MGSRAQAQVVVVHGLSSSVTCGIFPDQGPNPCPLYDKWIRIHCATREVPCLILHWESLFIVLPVKIYQVYLFIYRPIHCKIFPSLDLSNLGCVFHMLWQPAKKAWISLLSHLQFRLARAWGLQTRSICWNHSCKDTWAQTSVQTVVVRASHISTTKDCKLLQDMTLSLNSGPQHFKLHLLSTLLLLLLFSC